MNRNRATTLGVAVIVALAAGIASPAAAVGKTGPSVQTASAIAKAIERLPGPLAGTTFELASLTQADFERLQPLADAVLWLPEQGKARFFSSRSSGFAGEGQKKVIAPSEDVSAFLERVSTDYPDLTAGKWVLVSPVRLEGPAPAVSVPAPAPAGPNLQGQPGPNAAAIIFRDDFESPLATNWSISDNVGGTYQWGRRGCVDAHGGTWSAGAAAGGSLGPTSLCSSAYPNNYTTFMFRNSCDSVAGAATASLTSYYQVNSEAGQDFLVFGVPMTSGSSTYYGQGISGNHPGVWYLFTQDLRAWPSVGDLTARSCVDLAVAFTSNASVTYSPGAKVDDLAIGISTGGGVSPNCSPSAFTLCLFSNRFQVNATYDSYGSPSVYAVASATSVSDNTGFFTTATAGNVDVIVKMVNFCSSNNTWSAYIGGTTDLGVRIVITDKSTGSVYNASNPLGYGWVLIREAAFSCP